MSQKSYLRVDGIRGSSSDLGHVGELEVSQFSYSPSGESKTKNVKVAIQMELEPSFGVFYEKMMKNEKLKDATLTVETRNPFDQLFQTFKAEMKGLKVMEVSSRDLDFPRPQDRSWPIQKVTFLVDTIQFPKTVQSPELNDNWKAL